MLRGASQAFRQLTHIKLIHLVLQRTERNTQILSRAGHVPAALFERTKDEVAFEGVRGFFE
jgi:hypothetical protein